MNVEVKQPSYPAKEFWRWQEAVWDYNGDHAGFAMINY